jgi:hypothetical protein
MGYVAADLVPIDRRLPSFFQPSNYYNKYPERQPPVRASSRPRRPMPPGGRGQGSGDGRGEESQIRRAGRWSRDAAQIHAQDGFPEEAGSFFLPKAEMESPPQSWRIYPEVDQVTDLWNKWSFGRGSGPSIQQLDSAWGAKYLGRGIRGIVLPPSPPNHQGHPARF